MAISTNQSVVIDTGIVGFLPNGASGYATYTIPENGASYKKFIYYFQNFSFNSAFTNGFLYHFSKIAEVTTNTTGMITSNSTTSITFYPQPGISYTGIIIVEGF